MSIIHTEILPEYLNDNVFRLFGNDWPLITAGVLNSYNSMTAGWGGLGVLWRKKVATIYVRHQRYTFEFLEREAYFSLSFFNEKFKDALNFFGTKSGRNHNKAKETGLTPVEFENKTVYYAEADLVIILKKIYYQDFNPDNFLDPEITKIYAEKDYHRIYIGEIDRILTGK